MDRNKAVNFSSNMLLFSLVNAFQKLTIHSEKHLLIPLFNAELRFVYNR